jgi:hypothetical protein
MDIELKPDLETTALTPAAKASKACIASACMVNKMNRATTTNIGASAALRAVF